MNGEDEIERERTHFRSTDKDRIDRIFSILQNSVAKDFYITKNDSTYRIVSICNYEENTYVRGICIGIVFANGDKIELED
jgi:hypothetical protein